MASSELKREWLILAGVLAVLSRWGDHWLLLIPIVLLSIYFARILPLFLTRISYAMFLPLISLSTLPKYLRLGCAILWLAYTVYLAVRALINIIQARHELHNPLWGAVACLLLPGGAIWLLAFVADFALLGFSQVIVLLTAVHFHFAAISNLFILALLARVFSTPKPKYQKNIFITAVLVLLGFWLTAIGISTTKLISALGASVMTIAMLSLSHLLFKSSFHFKQSYQRYAIKFAATAIMIAMSLAIIFAVFDYLNWSKPSYLTMELSHGILNGLCYVYLAALILSQSWTDQQVIVIYDGHCGFCNSGVSKLTKIDWIKRFAYVPYQDEKLYQTYPKLNPMECEHAMHVVLPDGVILAGADAIRGIMWRTPLTFLFALILAIPPLPYLFRKIYPILARNRYRIAGSCHLK